MSEQEPGCSLREAREAAGLSQQDVADSLNLLVSNVQAIESNTFKQLNADIFVRGYIRSYARFLNLDAEPLLEAAERVLRAESRSAEAVCVSAASPIKPMHKVIAALVLAGLVWAGSVVWMSSEVEAAQVAHSEAQEA
ncbi:cytoskeletal protein RodZ [Litorivivens lipolytica]|uniref:Cytoskeletal protein RodZ n=1 Tax=Litorivivens lipolytica TaxID=1524264 RepID=A0A7W4W218_9GAMM|nr:cytoskeletal protein RodZ [Litorivivens lipolytica]